MREKDFAMWDREQQHMGGWGESFGTVQVSCRCTGVAVGEADLFLFDNSIPPGIENVDPEGDIRFLEELLIDDSILSYESSDSNFEHNPLISRPPPEPPDDNFDFEPEDYPPEIEVILCRIYVRFSRSSYPLIDFSLGKSISF
nr:hypothetical protein [Tanacetum cinerariifolium]